MTTERNFIDTSPGRSKWRVGSAASPYVVEITRNAGDDAAGDPLPIPNDFPVADGWVLAYVSNQVSDYSNLLTCPANLNSFDNDQNVNGADLVLWVRAAAPHQGEPGGVAADCSTVGPTIRVLPAGGAPVASKFHTLEPCRVLDTRQPAGPYGGTGSRPGDPLFLRPDGSVRYLANREERLGQPDVVAPAATGYLVAFPSGSSLPETSVVNFTAGQTRANNAILTLGTAGAVTLQSNVPAGSIQVVLDVTGWFE